jgi:hypothetical protein
MPSLTCLRRSGQSVDREEPIIEAQQDSCIVTDTTFDICITEEVKHYARLLFLIKRLLTS